MPTYGYHCTQCKRSLDIFQKITDAALKICPECGHETLKRGPGGGIGISISGTACSVSSQRIESSPCSTKPPGCCPCDKSK
jgi:putative FmdB family regulatory protein